MICPRCKGRKELVAYDIKGGKRSGTGELLSCPTCFATGEVDQPSVDAYMKIVDACSRNCTCGKASLPDPVENVQEGVVDYVCRRCGKKTGIIRKMRA